jgi:hypothetical protein
MSCRLHLFNNQYFTGKLQSVIMLGVGLAATGTPMLGSGCAAELWRSPALK